MALTGSHPAAAATDARLSATRLPRPSQWPRSTARLAVVVALVSAGSTVVAGDGDGANPAGRAEAAAPRFTLVQARSFDIDYDVNPEALPLSSVELWYRSGPERGWRRYGLDDDRQPPFRFIAEQEGAYAFFLVVTNATGASSRAPSPESRPHCNVFVDFTPPIVQLHEAVVVTVLARPMVKLTWSAVDAHLPPRPVTLSYRLPPDERWRPAEDLPLSNSGRYDWPVPSGLTGALEVRITVTDRAGNAVEAISRRLELTGLKPVEPAPKTVPGQSQPTRALASGDAQQDARRAEQFLAAARLARGDGDLKAAISALQNAVSLRPGDAELLSELASVLAAMEEKEEALEAYELVLKQSPTHRSALIGAAEIYVGQHRYADATTYLGRIVRNNPRDAEALMHLGDVAIYQGDEILAREHYRRAMGVEPKEAALLEALKVRMDNLAALSRNYGNAGRD